MHDTHEEPEVPREDEQEDSGIGNPADSALLQCRHTAVRSRGCLKHDERAIGYGSFNGFDMRRLHNVSCDSLRGGTSDGPDFGGLLNGFLSMV